MILIPAGRVTVSDRRTQRHWQVDLQPYLLAPHPTTQADYAAVLSDALPATRTDFAALGDGLPVTRAEAALSDDLPVTRAGAASDALPPAFGPPHAPAPTGDSSPGSAVGESLVAGGPGESPSEDSRLPVTGVSWWDAIRFCNALSEREGLRPTYRLHAEGVDWDTTADGYRLPTEAEWEHACRAGTTGPRYGPLDEIAWYRANSGDRIHEVGGKLPNAWGLHDMLGNAWDWCWDLYDPEVYGTYRVLRGGGWFDEHWSCRASVRRRSHPTFRVDDVGFRLARSVLP